MTTSPPKGNVLSRRLGAGRANIALRKAKRMSVGGVTGVKEGYKEERRARTCSPPTSLHTTPTSIKRRSKPLSSNSMSFAPAPISRDVEMTDFFNPQNLARFRLPTKLGRPAERPVRAEILAAVDPEIVDVPLEYLKDVLSENGTE